MRIVVAGCGKIGNSIIGSLNKEEHDLVVIDQDPSIIAEVTNTYDLMSVCGNALEYETLKEAEIDKAEMFIAVTGSDEFNMLSCFLAKRMGASQTIARIRTPEYNDKSLGFLRQQLDLSMSINPELLVASELHNILKFPSAVKIETFSRRNFQMVELKIKEGSPVADLTVEEARKHFSAEFVICMVQRGEEALIPDGKFKLQVGDRIGVCATPTEIFKLMRQMGVLKSKAKNVMILGATRTSFYLAKMLAASGTNVKIIDADKSRCEEFANELDGVNMICGNGAEQEVLLEEGIDHYDAFVSLTGLDEQNILISCYANSRNVPKVIAKVNSAPLGDMAEKIGLDSIVSPQETICNVIIQYARALQNSLGSKVETLYKLLDGKVEALEFMVDSGFKYTNVPLKDMQLKPNTLIAGIVRGRKAIIPSGNDMILPNDLIIVITSNEGLRDLSGIIK